MKPFKSSKGCQHKRRKFINNLTSENIEFRIPLTDIKIEILLAIEF